MRSVTAAAADSEISVFGVGPWKLMCSPVSR